MDNYVGNDTFEFGSKESTLNYGQNNNTEQADYGNLDVFNMEVSSDIQSNFAPLAEATSNDSNMLEHAQIQSPVIGNNISQPLDVFGNNNDSSITSSGVTEIQQPNVEMNNQSVFNEQIELPQGNPFIVPFSNDVVNQAKNEIVEPVGNSLYSQIPSITIPAVQVPETSETNNNQTIINPFVLPESLGLVNTAKEALVETQENSTPPAETLIQNVNGIENQSNLVESFVVENINTPENIDNTQNQETLVGTQENLTPSVEMLSPSISEVENHSTLAQLLANENVNVDNNKINDDSSVEIAQQEDNINFESGINNNEVSVENLNNQFTQTTSVSQLNSRPSISMSNTDLEELTEFKQEDVKKTDIKSLFDRVGVNVKEASDIFKRNTEMKEKIDSRFEELKKLQSEVSKVKKAQYDEINQYKEEVLSKLTSKKDEIEVRLNKLKEFQTSLEKEKIEFEQYRKSQKEEIERVQKEVQDAYDSRREELKRIEDVLRKQKDLIDEERNQLNLDRIQYESDKNELANNLLKFNEIVDSFTNGIDKIDKE